MIILLQVCAVALQVAYQFVFYWILHTFLPLRKGRGRRIAAFFVSLTFTDIIIYQNDLTNILVAFCALSIYLAVFHQGRLAEKASAVFIFYPIMVSMNFLMMDLASRIFFAVSAGMDLSFKQPQAALLVDRGICVGQNMVHLLFWGGIWLFLRNPLQDVRQNLTDKMWLIVDSVILVSGIACFTTIYFVEDAPFVVYPVCISSVFSSLGCVCLVSNMSRFMQDTYRLQALKMQQKYYQAKSKDEERIRAIYHDMKNHLLVLGQCHTEDGTGRMAEQLYSKILGYEDYFHTENEFLDVILKDKAEHAREKQIDFSAAVDFGGIDFIDPLDISTLFGNGLDNAIEASEKLPKGQRAILLKAGRVRDFVSIRIENCFVPEGGVPDGRTTKGDHFLHGFGISNMKKAAHRYGGRLLTKCENGTFVLKVLIPVPAATSQNCNFHLL